MGGVWSEGPWSSFLRGGASEEGAEPCQMGVILWAWPFSWGGHLVGVAIMWVAILWAWSFTWGGHLVGMAF